MPTTVKIVEIVEKGSYCVFPFTYTPKTPGNIEELLYRIADEKKEKKHRVYA